jgi:MOSC domain-containing protein YiiM
VVTLLISPWLEAGLRALPAAPADTGRLALIVRRRPDGSRETPERVHLTPEEGLSDDSWNRRVPRVPDMQMTVMRRDVAELIAHGQPLTTFGDNLFVEIDISAASLPIGSRLRVGEAVVEVTPHPHNGCAKFKARFGADALHFVNAQPTRPQNLRGIYWKVIEPGETGVGARIQVLSRP